ncbi:Uncharacterised protein [Mycobacterium tuberculosis]|nr:Uncharacterised protein [Mycobacterium tuberculosis]
MLPLGLPSQRHRQNLGLEPGARTHRAGHVPHETLVALLHLLGLGLGHLALQERQHTLEIGVIRPGASVAVAVAHVHLLVGAFQNRLAGLGRQLAPGRVDVEPERLAKAGHHPGEVLRGVAVRPRRHRTLRQGAIRIGHHQLRVDLLADAQTTAFGAGAVGRVERERPRLQVVDGQRVPVGAGQLLGEPLLAMRCTQFMIDEFEHHDPVGQIQRGFHRIGEPPLGGGLDGETVHHHLDVVLFLLFQLRRIGQRMHHTVDPHPAVALGVELIEQIGELALAGTHHRGQHQKPSALRHGQHLIDDLLRGLARDSLPAGRAVRRARARIQQPQVVVHLGDGPDRRSWVAVGRLLVDGHRRRQPLDEVDVRLVHLPEKLAGVGRQRLHVTPLPLGEDGVERERGLARSG